MKNLTILIFALLFIQITALSQPCLPEGITFTTQTQIDSFQINYPGCTEIEGDVTIFGDDITNLNGLSVLITIGGELNISLTNIDNLTGLDGLTTIGDNVKIYPNDSLTSLTGLENLITISGELALGRSSPGGIEGNPSLLSLEGLGNLASVEALNITWCGSLTDLTGLENITSIGDIFIAQNNSLTGLTGLENMTSVNGNLTIGLVSGTGWGGGNPSLTNLTALINLNAVGGDLAIMDNNSLTNLYGLNNIVSINGDLEIFGNSALTSLNGLDNIEPGSITDLFIYGNTSLSTCNVECICDYLAAPNGTIEIYDNAPGCNSQQEVEDACWSSVNEISNIGKFNIVPNPLESRPLITYTLESSSYASLRIIDLSGKEIVTLVNKYQQHGEQRVVFNTEGLKPGIYFCTLKTNEGMKTRKLIKP